MKKAYESPKVEKMAFNYSDAVVASGSGCHWIGQHGWTDGGCYDWMDPEGHYEGNLGN